MKRTTSTEKFQVMSYERSTVTEDDEERDPTPSFPPMRVVTTDGVTVDECTIPLDPELAMVPLRKCAAVIPFSKTLRRVS